LRAKYEGFGGVPRKRTFVTYRSNHEGKQNLGINS
jgi:hypothetical protein